MAETKTQRKRPAKATATRRPPAASRSTTAVDRTAELSEEVARSLEDGQRAAIEAVRKFVDAVDDRFPALPHGEGPSRRQEIIDSALEMADRLVHTQYDFIRKVVDSAGGAVGRSDGERSHETPFHTDSPEYPPTHRDVYHDNSLCDYGKEIKPEHRVSGSGGRARCDRCSSLASRDR
ncbi:MAG TPA: hypothetical protein VKG82_00700 [Solirubrobacteraceae bacterium]|nr:hypothetical protein [Solirubrobacteraceae bacterium]